MRACERCGSTYLRDVVFCGLDGERLVDTTHDLLLGRTVDRYVVEAMLGEGGMARVYRARHLHLEQAFALKILYGDMASEKSIAERFRREAQSAAQIRHPNVVAVSDFGVSAEGLTFMTMELLEGATLSEVLKRDGAMTEARAAAIARQVALGLFGAHSLGFVHRDLKPKNVMLVPEAKDEVAKILDFGLVRPLDPAEEQLTLQGQIFGTPPYMAPEQIGGGEVDARTDLYALGAMIYELLAGKPPFSGSMSEVFKKHLHTEPPALPTRSRLSDVALSLLQKSKEARPTTALEVVELLDRALEPTGISPRTSSRAGARNAPEIVAPPSSTSGDITLSGRPSDSAASAIPATKPKKSAARTKEASRDPMSVELFDSLELSERQIKMMARRSGAGRPLAVAFVAALVMVAAGWWFFFGKDRDPRQEPDTPATQATAASVAAQNPAPTPTEPPPTAAPTPTSADPTARAAPEVALVPAPAEHHPQAAGDPVANAPATAPDTPSTTEPKRTSAEHAEAQPGAKPVENVDTEKREPRHAGSEPSRDRPDLRVDEKLTFSDLDDRLLARLRYLGLGFRDVAEARPALADPWLAWRKSAGPEPRTEAMRTAFVGLMTAASEIRVTPVFLQKKLARIEERVRHLVESHTDEAAARAQGTYFRLEMALSNAKGPQALRRLARDLSALEGEIDALSARGRP